MGKYLDRLMAERASPQPPSQVGGRPECDLSSQYLQRLLDILVECERAEQVQMLTGGDHVKWRVREDIIEQKLSAAYGSDFNASVAIAYLAMGFTNMGRRDLLEKFPGRRIAEVTHLTETGTFEGRDPQALDKIGETLAIEPELDNPDVMKAYMKELGALPDVTRTYKDPVRYLDFDVGLISEIKRQLEGHGQGGGAALPPPP